MQSSDESNSATSVSPHDRILSVQQVAQLLGTSVQTVRSYLRLPFDDPDRLPGSKVGRSWRTTRSALETWLVRPHQQ